MESIKIPAPPEIAKMSLAFCRHERTRLRSEISFARSDAMCGGPSAPSEKIISACNAAIDAINARLIELAQAVEADGENPSSKREWASEIAPPM